MSNIFAILISATACIISFLLLVERFSRYKEDTRPYLSFKQSSESFFAKNGIGGAQIFLLFENVGKCMLRYDILKFDVFVNGAKVPDVEKPYEWSVLGIGVAGTFSQSYAKFFDYSKELLLHEIDPVDYKIQFEVEYYKIGKPKKKYKLQYEIQVEFRNKNRYEFYGKTFAN